MDSSHTVLLVEDHETTRLTLAEIMAREGYKVKGAATASEAMKAMREEEFDLVVTDLKLPDGDGLSVLDECKRLSPYTPVVLVTGHGSEEVAVQAMKHGAQDYLPKPLDLNRLKAVMEAAFRVRALHLENLSLQQELSKRKAEADLIGNSPAIEKVRQIIRQVAPTNATVLLTGETGVGKEVAAGSIVAQSERSLKPFRKINIAAMPRELVEAELFGYERGAFTGAFKMKKGHFEMADGGTLFLDEIGEMPVEIQVKLLRVLQEQAFERVGGTQTIHTDVRLICSTNRDLEKACREGHFREDLYYRINVIHIHIPPLRERREDIPALAKHFLWQFRGLGGQAKELTPRAMEVLTAYDWPGNVRQLRNVIERACLLCPKPEIDVAFIDEKVVRVAGRAFAQGAAREGVAAGANIIPLGRTLEEVEKDYILATLRELGGNKTKAAKQLGIGLKTLYRKLEKYGELPGAG